MPPDNNPPPDEQPDHSRISKAQKRLLITIGAVIVIAFIGWLVETLAPAPKKSGDGLPQVSVVAVSAPGLAG